MGFKGVYFLRTCFPDDWSLTFHVLNISDFLNGLNYFDDNFETASVRVFEIDFRVLDIKILSI